MDELKAPGKPFDISKREVWEAWEKVKANKGAPGVDGQSIAEFEKDLKNNLYKIWNRMSSGSYFPPPVRAVEIPKPHGGGTRMLGVPTVADRVAQTVVAGESGGEGRADLPPGLLRLPARAVRAGRGGRRAGQRCWKTDWVIDLDIRKFFDSVPWDLVVKAVEANTDLPWVVLYVQAVAAQRRCSCPTGPCRSGTGEPHRGPRSRRSWRICSCTTRSTRGWPGSFPAVPFERYVDDAVVHCVSEAQAQQVLAALEERMREVGLELHPDKTRIVYCQDGNRRGSYEHTAFTFLGYTFRPRGVRTKTRQDVHWRSIPRSARTP